MFITYHIADFFDSTPKLDHFHINRLEELPPLPAHVRTPHKHHFYEVLLIKTGKIHHNVDYQEYTVRAGNLFFISQGQLHFWSKLDRESMAGYRVMFTEDFFQLGQITNNFLFELIYLDNVYQTPLLEINDSNKQIFEYFDLMYEEFSRTDTNENALRALLFLTLTETQRIATTQRNSTPNKQQVIVYKQFIALVEQHFLHKWSIENYAEALHTTSRQLNRILQEVVGQSFIDIVQNRTILEAKRLLTFTSLTVNQISHQLGFEDNSYFARFFKKHVNLSPIEFRQKAEIGSNIQLVGKEE